MRGAVSVALVYHFFDFTDKSEHVASIIGMTIIVVVFSTMVFGAATKPLLDIMLGKQGHFDVSPSSIFCPHFAAQRAMFSQQHQLLPGMSRCLPRLH